MWINNDYLDTLSRGLRKTYSNLRADDFNWLLNRLHTLINHLAIRFNFQAIDKYLDQLYANNNRDLRALANLLMPYLPDDNDSKKNNMGSFEELLDISKMRYDLYNLKEDKPHILMKDDLDHNFKLLLQTLEACAHKLYINWFQTFPLKMEEIEEWEVYKNTKELLSSVVEDPLILPSKSILPQADIYQTIRVHLVEEILPIKWLIFDIYLSDRPVSFYSLLKLEKLWPDVPWLLLSKDKQVDFKTRWDSFIINSNYDRVVMALSIALAKTYRHNSKIVEANNIINLFSTREEEDDEDEPVFSKNKPRAMDALISILFGVDCGYIYDFLLQTRELFEPTWYHYSLENNGDILTQNGELKLTHKNIYNYSKSLISATIPGAGWRQFPLLWRSCLPGMKLAFLNRLTGKDTGWFSVFRYLEKTYGNKIDKIKANNWIQTECQNRLILIVFQSGVKHGLLSIYRPGGRFPYKTGVNLSEYKDCYYFPTGKKYPEKWLKEDLGNASLSSSTWTDNYAVDWISQIHLYHRFMHKSVILITGATGVGKSTQTPKLLLYSYKMLEYRIQARIICTVPRIAPAEGNATRIADEMALPLSEGNFIMQYKHSERSKTLDSSNYVRISTDGSVVETMFKSPFLVKGVRNIYEMIIVDEAHEHNSNMDIILSLAKIALLTNNGLKLVIISATIDDDEAIYRRYYRIVNDNRAYPHNMFLKQENLDRRFVDRRIHISAPGQTTKYKIQDFWLDPKEAIKAREKRMEYAVNFILGKVGNLPGMSLFFLTGQTEIRNACILLNQKLPSDMIALAFYSELPEEDKSYAQHIAKNLPTHTIHRETYYTEKTLPPVSPGTYKRAIIVATSIAEASLTIDGLSNIIDTGAVFSPVYDPVKDKSVLKDVPISNSSADQRRGRVGRISEGKVYHLYEQDYLKKNKTRYDITQKDMKETIYKLCRLPNKTASVSEASVSEKDSCHYPKFTGTSSKLAELYEITLNLIPKVSTTYYDYFGSDPSLETLWSDYKWTVYPDGYHSDLITDNKGQFYVIHPDELNLERNEMTGTIVKLITSPNTEYDKRLFDYNQRRSAGNVSEFRSFRMENFWRRLLPTKLIIYRDDEYFKSEIGDKLMKLSTEWSMLSRDWNHFIWYLNSNENVRDFVIFIISFLNYGADVKQWALSIKWKSYMTFNDIKDDKFRKRKFNPQGPIGYLYMLYCRFRVDFPELSATKFNFNQSRFANIDLKQNINEIRNVDPILENPMVAFHKLDKSYRNETVSSINTDLIEQWSQQQNISTSVMTKVIKKYIFIKYELQRLDWQKELQIPITFNPLTFETDFWSQFVASICRAYWKYMVKRIDGDYYDLYGDQIQCSDQILYSVPHKYMTYISLPEEKHDQTQWTIPVTKEQIGEAAAIDIYLYSNNPQARMDVKRFIPQRHLEIGEEALMKLIQKN